MYSTLLREPSSQQFILVKHVCAQCAFAIIWKWKYPYIVFLRCSRSILRLSYSLNIICRKALWWVEHHFIEHWTNLNTLYWSSNELEPVHILVIEHKHPIFGFERTNIELIVAFTRFTKLLIEMTQTSFFWTSNKPEHIHLLAIEHPIFGFEWLNIVRPVTSKAQGF